MENDCWRRQFYSITWTKKKENVGRTWKLLLWLWFTSAFSLRIYFVSLYSVSLFLLTNLLCFPLSTCILSLIAMLLWTNSHLAELDVKLLVPSSVQTRMCLANVMERQTGGGEIWALDYEGAHWWAGKILNYRITKLYDVS